MDAGDLLFRQPLAEGLPEQELLRARARLVARAAVADGAAAVNVGRRDLAMGLPFLGDLSRDPKVPWVSTNLRAGGGIRPFPRWRTVRWGRAEVAVVGLLPPNPPLDARLGVEVQPPAEALREIGPELARFDLVICLSNLGLAAEAELARQFPSIALIVGGGGSQLFYSPQVSGNAAILYAADRGRHLGVLDIALPEGRWNAPVDAGRREALRSRRVSLEASIDASRARGDAAQVRALEAQAAQVEAALDAMAADSGVFSHRVITLTEAVADDPEVSRWVKQYKEFESEQRRAASIPPGGSVTRPEVLHTGSAVCRSCHPQAYQAWLQTPHPRAYAALRENSRDPQCLECHAVRLERLAGAYVEPAVGCEACHGPGGNHRGRANIVRSPPQERCVSCHRGYHPGDPFSFGKAYREIRCDREPRSP